MVIMGFLCGFGVDLIARLVQHPLERDLGRQLLVDCRVGAGGNVGLRDRADARPDGYTPLAWRLGFARGERRTQLPPMCL